MKFIWKYLSRYKKTLALALALAAVNQVFSLLDPQIFRIIIDRFAQQVGHFTAGQFFRGIIVWLLASMGVAFVSRVAKNFQDYYTNVITQRLGTRLYATSVEHALSLPYSVFEDQRSGELLQKLQKARTDTQTLITSLISTVFFAAVGVVFVLIYATIVHWTIGLLFFLVIPIISGVTYLISRSVKQAQQNVVRETADLAGSTTETIRNVELVKSLGLDDQEIKRLNAVNEKILSLELRKIRIIRRLSFIQGTLVNTLRSALLLLMLWLLFDGKITIGQLFSLFIYSFFIFTPLADFGQVATQYQEARASVEILEAVLIMKPEPKPAQAVTLGPLQTIEFEHVRYQHQSASRPAISDINFRVQAGEKVAFVGPSGSGKTTIMKLIVGLYAAQAGLVCINNIRLDNIDLEAYRRKIGLVSQDTQLFAGTIRENLLFVNPHASDDECRRVLAAAAASSLLERGGLGLDTKIGEGGIKISGGEKQRLAIARSLLRNPDLIIFDEATSSLDSITEQAITETIDQVVATRPNLITVLVAHRLSTIARADRIYVLEKGKIIEQGNHQTLLNSGGLYAALWRQQSATSEA
ncbi:MAG: ABC transporter ATP-binding protein [Patescibacteria group bacterium]